jgi:isocitrate lyase
MGEAREFAAAIHAKFPGKLLAYNCSPSFNWATKLDAASMKKWREDLAALGYRFQFITLAGWHALNLSMFELATAYSADGMLGYSKLQQREFAQEKAGYRATKHQAFVGTGYFDAVQTAISASSSTVAMAGSTETEQFTAPPAAAPVRVVA